MSEHIIRTTNMPVRTREALSVWYEIDYEIVRFRDCKYCEPIRFRRIDGLKCVANSESVSVEPDGFCAWGEPKGESE